MEIISDEVSISLAEASLLLPSLGYRISSTKQRNPLGLHWHNMVKSLCISYQASLLKRKRIISGCSFDFLHWASSCCSEGSLIIRFVHVFLSRSAELCQQKMFYNLLTYSGFFFLSICMVSFNFTYLHLWTKYFTSRQNEGKSSHLQNPLSSHHIKNWETMGCR